MRMTIRWCRGPLGVERVFGCRSFQMSEVVAPCLERRKDVTSTLKRVDLQQGTQSVTLACKSGVSR